MALVFGPMPRVEVVRTYLQLESRDHMVSVAAAPEGVSVHELTPCPVAVSRRLYREVGERFHWVDRLSLSDEELATYLGRADLRVFVARESNQDLGFFELLRHPDQSIEIACFGLISQARGRGIGKWLLQRAVELAWEWGAPRIWLQTCTLDAPAALPNYLARGFVVYRSERFQQTIAEIT